MLGRKYSVWIGESTKQLRKFSSESVTSGVECSKERILSLRTETLRCEIHRREVSSMLQQTKRQQDAQGAESA